jgi:hyperosmotically inducible protein
MSKTFTRFAMAALALALATPPAIAADDDKKAGQASSDRARAKVESRDADGRDVGDTLGDAWLVTKVKAQFWDEDALDNSDINVDARDGVIILRGTVASQAGKARAVQVARATEGVKRVEDRLTIGMANRDDDDVRDARTAARDAKREVKDETRDAREEAKDEAKDAKAAAKEAKADAKEAARDAKDEAKDRARDSRDAVGTAGEAVTDGWITTKVKTSFVGEDALDDSDIDVDTNNGVVTLTGTVASEAGRARAVAIAKKIDGVKSVKDELRIERN